ncbi:MAG: glycosyltransferase, partial [Bacteroidota bacterium]
HIIDQYVWNKIIFEKGVGPLGMDVSRISFKNLEPKIVDLFTNDSYKNNAEKLGLSMQKESYKEALYRMIID